LRVGAEAKQERILILVNTERVWLNDAGIVVAPYLKLAFFLNGRPNDTRHEPHFRKDLALRFSQNAEFAFGRMDIAR
jgi:hypothetical protein